MKARLAALAVGVMLIGAGCTTVSGPAPAPRSEPASPSRPSTRALSAAEAERVRRIMVPLVQAMNNPKPLNKVQVAVMDDPRINAANAGGGQFLVTTGLLQKANDSQLMGVLAHEVAHDDLGHVAKTQALGTGLSIGAIILDQIVPGTGAITPVAGELILRGYTRREEYQADRHGVELLRRIGQPKEVMIDTLSWLIRTSGGGGGGFLSTHPATDDRIQALRELK